MSLAMVLVLLTDGTFLEVGKAVDVVRQHGRLDCLDPHGNTLASVPTEQALAYTLNPSVAIAMRAAADHGDVQR
jgi:hypothetical protein